MWLAHDGETRVRGRGEGSLGRCPGAYGDHVFDTRSGQNSAAASRGSTSRSRPK